MPLVSSRGRSATSAAYMYSTKHAHSCCWSGMLAIQQCKRCRAWMQRMPDYYCTGLSSCSARQLRSVVVVMYAGMMGLDGFRHQLWSKGDGTVLVTGLDGLHAGGVADNNMFSAGGRSSEQGRLGLGARSLLTMHMASHATSCLCR
jgi:hypothetical protein